ncbi:MAG: hypothetical protein BWK80_28160 [Desulfobacteraceae bacterium IS3]|nr:MAG: hypothetical protein BWK80_28160 [Desulfobacteraceae bacterium IS3]
MPDRIFIDTNIFIYAHLEEDNNYKNQSALKLFNSLNARIVVSTQVLNEYYSVMLRNKIEDEIIQKKLNIIADECTIADITIRTIRKAWEIRLKYRHSYWDSLILASALENSCSVLYSEDMQSNQVIEDTLTIINPLTRD